jgi:hypothetical protein
MRCRDGGSSTTRSARRRRLVLAVLAHLLAAALWAQREVNGLTFVAPEGFREYSTLAARADWDTSVALRNLGPSGDAMGADALGIDVGFWRVPKPPGFFDETLLETGVDHDVIPVDWTGLDLRAVRSESPRFDETVVTYTLDLPLENEAARVWVWGPTSRLDELESTWTAFLASLDGESNWPGQRRAARVESADALGEDSREDEPPARGPEDALGSPFNERAGERAGGGPGGGPPGLWLFAVVLLLAIAYIGFRISRR